ncbi:MAG: sugar phosphate isomerase/epimerase [Veillonella sp.]|uniref:sugar phosphate isomerase/epimerase family protein n=1 Tax=Veillonella sp. TaxID=1926307 RepID=UPI0025E3F31E|nr:TIM barrel protein [Veillonella sp.]MBE6080661.1 sugar phosphate isomerase/epimerase [Veillonella sp.]
MNIIAISDLLFPAFEKNTLRNLPQNLGMEFFVEFGSLEYWRTLLPNFQIKSRSISLHGPCVTVNLANPNDTDYLSRYEETFNFGKEIKAQFIVVHTNEQWTGQKEDIQKLVIERLQELSDLAVKINGPQLALENVGLLTYNLFNESEYIELFNKFPNIVSLIDVGHANVNQWNLQHVIQSLNEKIVAYHLHDNSGLKDEHQPINSGTINWSELFKSINTYSPNAIKVLEYANGTFKTMDELLQHLTSIESLTTTK